MVRTYGAPVPARPMGEGSNKVSLERRAGLRLVVAVAGTGIFILALVFLALNIRHNWGALSQQGLAQLRFGQVWASALFYAASVLSTVLAWPLILKGLDNRLPLRMAIALGLVTQIGKYLPGNIGHYLGRAALASRHSVSLVQSGVSTVVELGSAPVAAALFIALCVLIEPGVASTLQGQVKIEGASITVSLIILVLIVMGLSLWYRRNFPDLSWVDTLKLWARPVAALMVSFTLAGLSFFALIQALGVTIAIDLPTASVVFAVAWLAGFLVPGAPAGLGVREAIIIAFLTGLVGPAPAILCAVLHRVLSALVDVALALVGGGLLMGQGGSHGD